MQRRRPSHGAVGCWRVKPARSRHSTPFALLWRWPRSLPGPLRLEPGHSGLAGGLQRRPLRLLHGSAHQQQLRRPHSTATALRSADCGGACRRLHQGAAVPRLGSGSSSGCTPWRTALQAAAAKARSCLCASATSAGQSGCAELAAGCQPPAAGRFPLQSLLPAHLCACRSPSAEAVFKSGGLRSLANALYQLQHAPSTWLLPAAAACLQTWACMRRPVVQWWSGLAWRTALRSTAAAPAAAAATGTCPAASGAHPQPAV